MKIFAGLSIFALLTASLMAQASQAAAQEVGQDEPAAAQDSTSEDSSPEFDFNQDIDFDTDEFEGFEEGDFGAAQPTAEEDAMFNQIVIAVSVVGVILVAAIIYWLRKRRTA